jgi:DNA-binding NarL/FixJ family response regulator
MIDSIASQAGALANQGQAATAARGARQSAGAETEVTATKVAAQQSSASAEQSAAVTVELSAQAQAKQLKTEGLSGSEIATKLKLDVKTVDSYLGVES